MADFKQKKRVSHRKVPICLKRGIIPSRLSFGVGTAEVSQEGHSERKLFLKGEIENKKLAAKPSAGFYRNFRNKNARQVYQKDRRNWANYSE